MQFAELLDRHPGETFFIIGAGPSLRHADTSLLPGITITVNSGCLKVPHADYWVSDDQDTRNWSYFHDIVMPSKSIKMMDAARLGRYVPDSGDVVKYPRQHCAEWCDPGRGWSAPLLASFHRDTSHPLVGTRTSAATAIHLAWIMGAKTVVLLGCDCKYEQSKRYFWEFPGHVCPTRVGRDRFPNRLTRDVYGNVTSDTHCQEMVAFWRNFRNLIESRTAMEIWNASSGADLGFKEVNLAELSCQLNATGLRGPN